MLNYIRAEVYKLLRRKYTYIALGVMLALEALLVWGFVFINSNGGHSTFANNVLIITMMGGIGFCTCLLTGDIVFAGQYKNSTLKNEVSFGLSRTRVYLGKFIVQTLLSLAYMVIMVMFYVAGCWLFLFQDPEMDWKAVQIIGYFLAVGLPLWVGGQAAACMCQFLINGDLAASFVYVGMIFASNAFIELTGLIIQGGVGRTLLKIYEHLPSPMLETAKSVVGDPVFLGKAWIVGLFWVAACTAIGLYGFYRKEIK